MESIKMVDGQIIGHFFVYNTHVTIVAAGNRIRCTACLVNGSWCTIPRPVWIKDSGINEFKIRCRTERTQRRSGGRSVRCIALAGGAAGCNTAGVGGRTRISAEGEVGLRLDYRGHCIKLYGYLNALLICKSPMSPHMYKTLQKSL